MTKPTRVIFIAGAGRSGSTLLEMLLSRYAGVVSTGELRRVWAIGLRRNHLCSCGARFRACAFWCKVFQRAFGGFEKVDGDAMEQSAREILRLRHGRDLARGCGPADPAGRHAAYLSAVGRLYQAIREVGHAEIVVDSSKSPTYGNLLAGLTGLELRVIHLVRDSRAVAFSWRRRKKRRDDPALENWMPLQSYRRSALKWDLDNLMASRLARRAQAFTRLRYEELAVGHKLTLPTVLGRFGLPERKEREGGHAGHSVMGNPVRFEDRPVVRLDDAWRRRMPAGAKVLVTLMTAPLLAAYGYRLRT